MLSVAGILFTTFVFVGQLGVFFLLATFFFARSLRNQKNNTFMINFLITTFLGGIIAMLLVFTGHFQLPHPPKRLCLAQAILLDGTPPMFGIAFLVVVINTLLTLRASFSGVTSIMETRRFLRLLMILAPYVTFIAWCMVSLSAALRNPPKAERNNIIYCSNFSLQGNSIRRFVGYFMICLGFLKLTLLLCIGLVIYRNLYVLSVSAPLKSYHQAYWQCLRISVLLIWEMCPIIISAVNSVFMVQPFHVKEATQVISSMNAIGVTVVFGTQKAVLDVWNIRKARVSDPAPRLDGPSSSYEIDSVPMMA